jgi:hypothetical protein
VIPNEQVVGLIPRTIQAILQRGQDLEETREITLTANCLDIHLDHIRDLCVGIPNCEPRSMNNI